MLVLMPSTDALIAIVKRHTARGSSFRSGLLVGLAVGIICLFLPNRYRSEARVLAAEARTVGGATAAVAAATVGIPIPGQDTPDAAYVDILQSRSLREALLKTRFEFKTRRWYFGAEVPRNETLFEYLNEKNMDRAFFSLKKYISVSRDMKTKLLTISAETSSPELSQQITRRVLELLDEFVVTKSRTRGGAKAEFAERRLKDARQEMIQAQGEFQSFVDKNRNYLYSSEPGVHQKGLLLEGEFKLRVQIVTTLSIALEQALLEEKNDIPILNVLDPGNLPIEKSGPFRSLFVIFGFLLGCGGSWAFRNRVWLLQAARDRMRPSVESIQEAGVRP